MSFSNCIPFYDKAKNGYIVVENVVEKGGTHSRLVDGGKVYRDVDKARERAMELAGTERYERGGRYTTVMM